MRAKWRALRSGCCGVPQNVLDKGNSVRDGRIVGNASTITSLIDLLPKTSGRRLTIRFLFAYTDWHAGRT